MTEFKAVLTEFPHNSMNKLPTAFSLPVLAGAVKRAIAYSKHFQYSKQRQNFIYLICSILFNNSCLLNAVQSITLITKSWTACLSYFLKSNAWNSEILNQILLSLFGKHHSVIKYIALDWTALVKSGKSFKFVGDVYDGRDGKIKNGFPLLLALAIAKGKSLTLPLLDKLASWTQPEFRSENDIINNFLLALKERLGSVDKSLLNEVVFLLDAGFYRTTIIKQLLKLKLLFIINAVGDRVVVLTDNQTGQKRETKLDQLQPGYYEKVYLKHLRRQMSVAIYFEKNKKGELEKRILVSNLKKQSLEEMKMAYKHRWAIEEYFKELKDKYNLENFRVREFRAIERIIKLILIANALFIDSLESSSYYAKQIKTTFEMFFNLSTTIKKKGISLFREIAQQLANFGLVNDFKLILSENLVNSYSNFP